jgi:hypothetical protein
MTRFLKAIISAVLLTVLACPISVTAAAAAEQASAWSVTSVIGKAQSKAANGDWQTMSTGQHVGVGQQIRTGNEGRVLLSRGDESIIVSANSTFEMQPASSGMMTRVYQTLGTLMFKVHKQPNKHFEVQTPYLVAAVKGTAFTVSIDGNGGAVHVTEGLVEVGNVGGPDKILVRPGNTASVAAKRGSTIQLGVTPKKGTDVQGKQSEGPRIDRDMGAASVDIERSSNGLFKSERNPSANQSASREKGDSVGNGNNGNALGKDKGLGDGLGNGMAVGKDNGTRSGNGNSSNSGAGNSNAGGNGNAIGLGNSNAGGNGNSNAGGNGKGKGKGNGKS